MRSDIPAIFKHTASTYKRGIGLLTALLLAASPAFAGAEFLENPEAQSLYAKIMRSPGDRSLNMRYATLAARMGDYEAAIPPLERLLLSDPDDPWLQLQLGNLYKALGSKAMAQTYLKKVVQGAQASADTKAQARQSLSEL